MSRWYEDWGGLRSPSGQDLSMDPDRFTPLDFGPPEPKAPVVHEVRLVNESEGYPLRVVAWWAECLTCSKPVGYLYPVRGDSGAARAKAEADALLHRGAATAGALHVGGSR